MLQLVNDCKSESRKPAWTVEGVCMCVCVCASLLKVKQRHNKAKKETHKKTQHRGKVALLARDPSRVKGEHDFELERQRAQ